jgi:phage terminase Nu1 subunit (DNA packaging protein)
MRSAEEMAALLGLHRRRINQLVEEGVLTATKGGKMDMKDGVQAYLRFIRDGNKNRAKTEAGRANLEARTRMLNLMIAREKSELIPLEDSRQLVAELTASFRVGLAGLSERLVACNLVERARIEAECDRLRRDLARAADVKLAALGEKATNRTKRRPAGARHHTRCIQEGT